MHCPHCGAKHQEDGFKCTNCGQMIHVQQKTTWKQIVIGAVILIILGVVAFVFISQASNKEGIFAGDEHESFNDYTWEELAKISSDMTLAGNVEGAIREAKKYEFVAEDGSLRTDLTKEFSLADGTTLEAQLVALYHDPRSNNSGNAGMTFIVRAPIEKAAMNETATNQGGWEASALRASLSDSLFSKLPSDLQKYIVEVKKPTNNTGATNSTDAVTTTKDKLFALSYIELMGASEGNVGYAEVLNAEGSQYELLSNPGAKSDLLKAIASDGDLNWWLRSPNPETNAQFFSAGSGYDTEQSDPLSMEASDELSVVIAFCI